MSGFKKQVLYDIDRLFSLFTRSKDELASYVMKTNTRLSDLEGDTSGFKSDVLYDLHTLFDMAQYNKHTFALVNQQSKEIRALQDRLAYLEERITSGNDGKTLMQSLEDRIAKEDQWKF